MLSDIKDGGAPLSPGLAARLLREFRCNNRYKDRQYQYTSEGEKRENLTQRQLEVLEMVARGITYKEAGEVLGLTERTIKYHIGRILELLHLENRAQLIMYAAHIGIIDDKETNG